MDDEKKTKKQLIEELNEIRLRLTESHGSKRADEALMEYGRKYHAAFELCSDSIFWADIQTGIIIDCNQAAERMIGLPRDKIIGQHQTMLHPPELKEFYAGHFRRHSENGSTEESEAEVISALGQRIPVLISATRLVLGDRKLMHGIFRDITEIKKTSEALLESERRFRAIADHTPEWEDWVGPDCKLIWVNPSVYDLTGYSADECMNMNDYPAPMAHEADRERMMSTFNSSIQGSKGKKNEFRLLCKDGSVKWADVSWQPIFDDKGCSLGHRASIRDITERKQMEIKLRDMLNFLHTLFNTIPSPIFCKDFNGLYVDCNKEFETYVGAKRNDIIGKSVYDLHSQDIADKYNEMDLALFRQPGRQVYEHPITYSDGTKHEVVVNKATYQNEDGTLAGLVGVMVDITERKRAEEESRQRNILMKAIVDNIPNTIFLKDAKELRFILLNPAGEDLTGYSSSDLLGKNDYDFVPKEQADFFTEKDRDVLRGRHVVEIQTEPLQTRNKGLRTLHTKKVPILNADGEPEYLLGISEDITERKEAEDELARYREGLEQLVAERTQELENKTQTLEEVNIALKVLLQHREEDKKELGDRFVMNVNNLIIPFAEKMKSTNLDERQLAYLGIIETHLKDITSSMIKKFNQFNLTPAEVEVAALIKEGKATKEIAKIIGIATSTIDTHRNNIRKKLGISQEAVNLRSHLQSFN